jgi:hypothetical protein
LGKELTGGAGVSVTRREGERKVGRQEGEMGWACQLGWRPAALRLKAKKERGGGLGRKRRRGLEPKKKGRER